MCGQSEGIHLIMECRTGIFWSSQSHLKNTGLTLHPSPSSTVGNWDQALQTLQAKLDLIEARLPSDTST